MTQRLSTHDALLAGLWVPCYYGNHFKVCRQKGRRMDQENSPDTYQTLAEARAECDRRNGRRRICWED